MCKVHVVHAALQLATSWIFDCATGLEVGHVQSTGPPKLHHGNIKASAARRARAAGLHGVTGSPTINHQSSHRFLRSVLLQIDI